MYLNHKWYKLTINPEMLKNTDPVERLDISILQKHFLSPILGIDDPRLVDAALAFASAKVLAVVSQPTVSRHRVNGTAP